MKEIQLPLRLHLVKFCSHFPPPEEDGTLQILRFTTISTLFHPLTLTTLDTTMSPLTLAHRDNKRWLSRIRFLYRLTTFTLFFGLFQPVTNVPKNLSLPTPALCAGRKIHTNLGGSSGYYVSWFERETRNTFLNWLDARNWCRERCMDLISMETPAEIQFVKRSMLTHKIEYCWTSGRLCDFKGCDRPDLRPAEINGWFWSGSEVRMRPTNERSSYNDWSFTGGLQKAQPDNRESTLKGGYTESCLAVLNNLYKDGVVWHDVACHHIKSFVCEDSVALLKYARAKEPSLRI